MTNADAPIPRTAVLALSLAAFASGVSLRINDALLPRLAGDFSISIGHAAGVITVFSVAYGLAQLLFGPLGDRFGKYLVVAWGCAACAITASLCGLAQTFPQLLVARLLAGATAAAIIPLSMAWIGDVVPYARRQPVLARFLIGQIMGLSVGVWMGGFAADSVGWRLPFLVIGVGFATISAVLFMVNRQLPASARQQRAVQGHPRRTMLSEFGQVLSQPWARVVLLTVFTEGAFLYGAFAFIASHLHGVFGVSLSTAGAVVMWFGFGGLLFAIFSATLVRRLGEVGLSSWGGVLIAASLLAVGLAPVWWWAIPACFVMGLGFYMLHNTLQINATQMAPERRGAAVSSFASCFFLGQAAGVAAGGALTAYAGTRWVLLAGALGALLVALNFSRLRAEANRRALRAAA
ncbi:Predicted arabinose efflux permease, MFS family [Rhodoferax sp. OV413]|uniref:MFS transporter n=1 Tax=Rhodoferax sp. OV413 TaxID=1855285 RepID=UPI000889B25C|nr:MFS transporter [Rhodoferax sp. OV413]SDO42827.1 Predicted arabinose efflux permease, MFS family [Rhodoferax sp. OV413]